MCSPGGPVQSHSPIDVEASASLLGATIIGTIVLAALCYTTYQAAAGIQMGDHKFQDEPSYMLGHFWIDKVFVPNVCCHVGVQATVHNCPSLIHGVVTLDGLQNGSHA